MYTIHTLNHDNSDAHAALTLMSSSYQGDDGFSSHEENGLLTHDATFVEHQDFQPARKTLSTRVLVVLSVLLVSVLGYTSFSGERTSATVTMLAQHGDGVRYGQLVKIQEQKYRETTVGMVAGMGKYCRAWLAAQKRKESEMEFLAMLGVARRRLSSPPVSCPLENYADYKNCISNLAQQCVFTPRKSYYLPLHSPYSFSNHDKQREQVALRVAYGECPTRSPNPASRRWVIGQTAQPYWSSGTAGQGPSILVMQGDGNLVLTRTRDNGATWFSNTWVGGHTFLALQDDGNLVIYKGTSPSDNKGFVWDTQSNRDDLHPGSEYDTAHSKYKRAYLAPGDSLSSGEYLISANGKAMLMLQGDGNLVLYTWTCGECASGSRPSANQYCRRQCAAGQYYEMDDSCHDCKEGYIAPSTSAEQLDQPIGIASCTLCARGYTLGPNSGCFKKCPDGTPNPDSQAVVIGQKVQPYWSSGTAGQGPSILLMQGDGNLVLTRTRDNRATWFSDTWVGGHTFLALQDDGNLVIYKGTSPSDNKGFVWDTRSNRDDLQPLLNADTAHSKYKRAYLAPGDTLSSGEYIISTNGKAMLMLQRDGNLVLYTSKETKCLA